MRVMFNAVLLLVATQTLNLPAVAAEPLTMPASASATLEAASEAPKNNDLTVDITKICAIPAYPVAARRYGMQGKTVLKLKIDETGKINAFQLAGSSGWKILDLTVMRAIIGC